MTLKKQQAMSNIRVDLFTSEFKLSLSKNWKVFICVTLKANGNVAGLLYGLLKPSFLTLDLPNYSTYIKENIQTPFNRRISHIQNTKCKISVSETSPLLLLILLLRLLIIFLLPSHIHPPQLNPQTQRSLELKRI
jgi:hypothetical protein